MRFYYYCILLLIVASSVKAQPVSTSSKRAEKLYREARQLVTLQQAGEAMSMLEKVIEIDEDFIEAYLLFAEAHYQQGNIDECLAMYDKGLHIDTTFYPLGFYNMGVLSYENGRYKQALESFAEYQEYAQKPLDNKNKLEYYKKCSEFGLHAVNNPVPFEPEGLGEGVNSEYDEYWPTLSADEKMLVFTVMLPINKNNPNAFQNRQEDFYVSYYENGQWTPAKSLGKPLNTDSNEGAQTISADGRLMVYTACRSGRGSGRCELYIAEREGDQWSQPKRMKEPVNTPYKETQPSLSFNGRTLYFASDRPGSKGKLDLWVSHRSADGNWSDPENLGDRINTPGDEMSPFIHHDDQTLYFASNNMIGLGGFDIYRSKKNRDGSWSDPENLGYPINTHNDEIGLIVNTRGNRAYYSSDREDAGKKDIYSFELPEKLRPVSVSYFKGTVFDKLTKEPLDAHFELINLLNGQVVNESKADPKTGQFLLALPPQIEYMINVSHPGYLFFSEHIEMTEQYEQNEPFLLDIPLQPIREGVNIVLRNIFYKTDEYALQEQSKFELNKLIAFLQENGNIHVQINGYTDNVGTSHYNLVLAENRAKTVADYLVQNGIADNRISYAGYGQQDPIADNNTPEGRAKNRRTELQIVKVGD